MSIARRRLAGSRAWMRGAGSSVLELPNHVLVLIEQLRDRSAHAESDPEIDVG